MKIAMNLISRQYHESEVNFVYLRNLYILENILH